MQRIQIAGLCTGKGETEERSRQTPEGALNLTTLTTESGI